MSHFNSAEVHFHQQEQLSVYTESNTAEDKERLGELGLLSFYCLRILYNLGTNEHSDRIAAMLLESEQIVPLLAAGEATGGFELVAYPGHPGRHSFLFSLTWGTRSPSFDLKTKGFGFFAKGMGYYGPISILGLLRYLVMKRATDSAFHNGIANATFLCGQLHLNREIGAANQNQYGVMAMALGAAAMSESGSTPET